MTKITLKIAQNSVLAAMFLSTAAFAAPAAHDGALYAPTAKQTVAVAQAKVACDALEGTPDCRNGFMPLP